MIKVNHQASSVARGFFSRLLGPLPSIWAEHPGRCGMALGYADPEAPVNRLRSDRASVDEFASFHFD